MSSPIVSLENFSYSKDTPTEAPLLLLVDDARVMRVLLQDTLEKKGYQILMAESGEQGLDLLAKYGTRIDAVILDREMPGIDGLEVVRRMKEDFKLAAIPVIMFTAIKEPEQIQEGIDAGVFYYLIKPAEGAVLQSIIEAALRESRQKRFLVGELSLHGGILKIMRSCQLSIRTVTEAEDASCMLAACFPNPERVVAGFMELLMNSIEHGNLGIHYEEKHRLLTENIWQEELERRATLPENKGKTVEITYQRKDGNHLVQINDAGPGFDWKRYWHINPARATASHGRGIARARLMAFDRMSYNEAGNSVTVMVNGDAEAKNYAW